MRGAQKRVAGTAALSNVTGSLFLKAFGSYWVSLAFMPGSWNDALAVLHTRPVAARSRTLSALCELHRSDEELWSARRWPAASSGQEGPHLTHLEDLMERCWGCEPQNCSPRAGSRLRGIVSLALCVVRDSEDLAIALVHALRAARAAHEVVRRHEDLL